MASRVSNMLGFRFNEVDDRFGIDRFGREAGAFGEEANAARLGARLKAEGYATAFVRQYTVNGRALFRVHIGPVPSVDEFDRAVDQLKKPGIDDPRLAAE